jgi:hypothetical protein
MKGRLDLKVSGLARRFYIVAYFRHNGFVDVERIDPDQLGNG